MSWNSLRLLLQFTPITGYGNITFFIAALSPAVLEDQLEIQQAFIWDNDNDWTCHMCFKLLIFKKKPTVLV